MFEFCDDNNNHSTAVIKVIGVGGAGGNVVDDIAKEVTDVPYVRVNTDAQALANSDIGTVLQIGKESTRGLGAGANPEVGKLAAEEDREKIYDIIKGTDMLFIAAGMGGGTGTGAAPVFAQIAKELGVLTVAVVTDPFSFEGPQRKKVAKQGIEELSKYVDSLITIPNDKLLTVLGKNASLLNAFSAANNVLLGAVKGISDLILRPGLINVDFADVRTVMSAKGKAMMGTGEASGENRAQEAAEAAISSPLLEDVNLQGAKGVLVNLTGGLDMSIEELRIVGDIIRGFTSDDAVVVVGTVVSTTDVELLRVTVVVTGICDDSSSVAVSQPSIGTTCQDDSVKPAERVQPSTIIKGGVDYERLQQPPSMRTMSDMSNETNSDEQLLDVPAFLRKQDVES